MLRFIPIVFIYLSLSACGGYTLIKPQYIDQSFVTYPIKTITMLPLLDARGVINDKPGEEIKTSVSAKFSRDDHNLKNDYIRNKVPYTISAYLVSERGYDVRHARNYGEQTLEPIHLKNLDTGRIKKLNPNNARFTFLTVLLDTESSLAADLSPVALLGLKRGSAVMMGYLFDTQTGKVLWKHVVEGVFAAPLLVGAFFPGEEYVASAIQDSSFKLIRAMPPMGTKQLVFEE